MAKNTFDPQALDPLSRAIPGQSLTDAPGQWPFEKPPQIVEPQQALELVKNSVESPSAFQDILNLLDIGISAETLASSIVLKMFSEGVFTPDIAEMIKLPLVAHITAIGVDAGIEDINVVNELPQDAIDPTERMNLIQKINPDKAQREMDRVNSQEEFDEMLLNMEIPEEPMQTPKQSFLEMEVQ
tara:strand:- start:547 stop:1101 length:555 start_codon:yes stop_codon:yes gene_type:complete